VNYYEHHLADYTQATAHLSMVEDAAYSRILRWYYANEKALPLDVKQIDRLVRAQSKVERDAVRTVLAEFFTEHADGFHQDRADREIQRYQDKQRKASASANSRWNRNQQHSDGNANASPNAMRTHSDGNAHQTPDTRHQTPDREDTHSTTPAGHVCLLLRRHGVNALNPGHPDFVALVDAGVSDDEWLSAADAALAKGKGFTYLLGVVKGRRADAATGASSTRPSARRPAATERQIATMDALCARKPKDQSHATDGPASTVRDPGSDPIDVESRTVVA